MSRNMRKDNEEERRMRARMEAFDDGSDNDSDDSGFASSSDNDENKNESNSREDGSEVSGESEGGYSDGDEDGESEGSEGSEARQNVKVELTRRKFMQTDVPLFERIANMHDDHANAAGVLSQSNGVADGEKVISARQRNRLKRQKEKAAAVSGSNSKSSQGSNIAHRGKGIVRRGNKHMPSEMSSTKPVSRFREISVDASQKRKRSIDPRFNELNGKYSEKHFYNNYKFLDGYQEDEVSKLERAYKKVKSADTKQVLKRELVERKQQMKSRRHKLAVQDRLAEIKRQEKAKVAAGIKKPYFLKKSEMKDIALEEKYSELKKSGELKKYMQKKQLKDAQKDKRWMPASRVAEK